MEPVLSASYPPPPVCVIGLLKENSRLGFRLVGSTVHQGFGAGKYLIGIGDTASVVREAWQESLKAQQQNTNSTTTTVTLNSRPADIPGGQLLHDAGINHEWISTPDGTDVGMGTAKGVPQSDAPGVQTQVVDHTGQVPTSTQTFTGVDKAALATYTKVGTPTGRWVPGVNDCNTWAHGVISNSTPHDVRIVMNARGSTYVMHNVVVYADGSMHSPGGQ